MPHTTKINWAHLLNIDWWLLTFASDYSPVTIKGSEIERVETYTYLGIKIDNKLNWQININNIVKKLNVIPTVLEINCQKSYLPN